MRILFINPFMFRLARGIERIVAEQANALSRKGHQVTILSWATPKKEDVVNLDERVKLRYVPYSRYYQSTVAIPFYIYHLQAGGYDHCIIHWAGYGESEAITIVKKITGMNVSLILHYPYQEVRHQYECFKKYNFWYNLDHIIPTSNFVAQGVKQFCGTHYPHILNGVNLEQFRPDQRSREKMRNILGLRAGDRVLLTVAALEKRKGIQWCIRALKGVVERIPDAKLIVLGEGEYRIELESLIKRLKLTEHVYLYGITKEVAGFYNLADILLLLSRGEASPLVPIEAMACGTPVITSKHDPFPEIINEKIGWMVDETETDVVANAIVSALADTNALRQRGLLARQYVEERFDWNVVIDKYIRILSSAIDTKNEIYLLE